MSADLKHLTAFRTAAQAKAIIELRDKSQLLTLSKQLAESAFIIMGGGSNILFADDYDGVVLVNRLRENTMLEENEKTAVVRLGAGENWHDIVCQMSAHGFYGLENLALIPGTVGAAPVQNIGAYGVEVASFVREVEVFDLQDNQLITFDAVACEFGYRDSVFKRPENRQRYIITTVTLALTKLFAPVLFYKGLEGDDRELTAEKLLKRVIAVRQSKLPDPDEVPNAGSFFKNPVVTREQLEKLQSEYDDIPFFEVDENNVKISAAWLLEKAGFKGERRSSGAGVYEKHALILVNRGEAHGREIYALACDMMQAVAQQFAVSLTPEVRIIGAVSVSQ